MNFFQVVFFIVITLLATMIAGSVTVVSALKPRGEPLWEGHVAVKTSTLNPPLTFIYTWLAVEIPLTVILVFISYAFDPYVG